MQINELKIESVKMGDEDFFKITNVGAMRPFFMSIVSSSNHWMFIASNGGLSVGRKDADHALFPYYTDDKITESIESTGSKSIFQLVMNDEIVNWEPFSVRSEDRFRLTRNLYKSEFANKIIFEEINHDLGLQFNYEWNSSDMYGFVKKARLLNISCKNHTIRVLDGLQNIVPDGVGSDLQNRVSNLTDAYKRSELHAPTGLGIFALSALIVDKAEPSEALKANTVWCSGFNKPTYLLSCLQMKNFRQGEHVHQEEDIKGEKGAYFAVAEIELNANGVAEWMFVANVGQGQPAIAQLCESIKNDVGLSTKIQADIDFGTRQLLHLALSSDALQITNDRLRNTRHYSNVLFNIMRGGIFDENYQIEKQDFCAYLQKANRLVFNESQQAITNLAAKFTLFELKEIFGFFDNTDFERLATEYLPLKFSRRHGDPTRPWNHFTINTKNEVDGGKILDYQGNWRDIFQNWEALAHSFPFFIEGMIAKFLNASTFDGYNPYRVTKDGFDWETIEPDNPWSYIGYWGDHQIIYLAKFLEFIENCQPGCLVTLLHKNYFVYANVPYSIKSYDDIVRNPKDTILFDHEADKKIRQRIKQNGADGALLTLAGNEIYHVNFVEKILATVLSKLSNFVPEGGIWMNTQRPEWNDANNALVGNGVSMVTLCYLTRFLRNFQPVFEQKKTESFAVSVELSQFFFNILNALTENQHYLSAGIGGAITKQIVDRLGVSGSNFRNQIYAAGFSGKKQMVACHQILALINVSLQFLEHSIKVNQRPDHLYHAYNLMAFEGDEVTISHLSEMLEGQVAVLSSGFLTAEESLQVLRALKSSALFREDQYSYMLYPNKQLPKFLEKNNIAHNQIQQSELLQKLLADGNLQIVEKDINGRFHFNANFKNANDVKQALGSLPAGYQHLYEKDKNSVLEIFEQVFNHKSFTGRSGTFYGYEGLGSIYWHMVSKLLLAVQETCLKAIGENENPQITNQLVQHYYEINEGIGVHKPPTLYGAFPTDPYSHTPLGKGAQQPGMTGQVKEDILCRLGELGVFVKEGKIYFNPCLLRKGEFLAEPRTVGFVDVHFNRQIILVEKNSLLFSYVQVPVIYVMREIEGIEIKKKNSTDVLLALFLDENTSGQLFKRSGEVERITVFLQPARLRD